jgi:hypothetical protein
MAPERMVFLGFGKYARADKIYALEPILGDERGGGRRTRVWVEGVEEPLLASRTERTILHDMGQDAGSSSTSPSASPRPRRKAASISAISAGARVACWPRRPSRPMPRSCSERPRSASRVHCCRRRVLRS